MRGRRRRLRGAVRLADHAQAARRRPALQRVRAGRAPRAHAPRARARRRTAVLLVHARQLHAALGAPAADLFT